jgi:hypothetical protein
MRPVLHPSLMEHVVDHLCLPVAAFRDLRLLATHRRPLVKTGPDVPQAYGGGGWPNTHYSEFVCVRPITVLSRSILLIAFVVQSPLSGSFAFWPPTAGRSPKLRRIKTFSHGGGGWPNTFESTFVCSHSCFHLDLR